MLRHLDENEQRWRVIADEETSRSKTQQAPDSSMNVTHASVELAKVDTESDTSLPVVVHTKRGSESDGSSVHMDQRSADGDASPNRCGSMQVESRRGSLPTSDTVPLIMAGPRRNSAPVISHCAALTVKKYLLATLAEHSSSFCTRNSSCESEHFFPTCQRKWQAPATAGSQLADTSYVGCVQHHVVDVYHRTPAAKKSAWSAVAPFSSGSTCVAVEGRPRDRRSNSHALVFRPCLFAGRLTGRRFSSPAVGQDHRMSCESDAVPLLSPVIPSTSICSHSALVNWCVVWLFSELSLRLSYLDAISCCNVFQLVLYVHCVPPKKTSTFFCK